MNTECEADRDRDRAGAQYAASVEVVQEEQLFAGELATRAGF